MEKTKLIPAIRFNSFTDDWEWHKLGSMGTTYTGLSGKTKEDFGHGDAKFITYMNVFSNPIIDPDMVEPIEIDNKQKEVEIGDAFFTTSSETPEEVGMSSVLLEKKGCTYLNSFCFGYRPTERLNLNYLAFMLRSKGVRKDIVLLAQGISRYNISKNKMMEIEVPVPTVVEQEKIGGSFRNIDNLIAFYRCKLKKIQTVKQSLLEKMFPRNGSNVPEIRLGGFAEVWEQRTLDELVDYVSSNLAAKDSAENGLCDLYDANGAIGKTNNKPMSVDYITVIKDGAGVGRIRKLSKGTMFIGTMGALVSKNSDLDFVYSLLTRFSLSKMFSGSTIPHIYFKDYGKNCYYTPRIEEQRKIGRFFERIDMLIDFYQTEIDKMQDIKNAFLDKMFVKVEV